MKLIAENIPIMNTTSPSATAIPVLGTQLRAMVSFANVTLPLLAHPDSVKHDWEVVRETVFVPNDISERRVGPLPQDLRNLAVFRERVIEEARKHLDARLDELSSHPLTPELIDYHCIDEGLLARALRNEVVSEGPAKAFLESARLCAQSTLISKKRTMGILSTILFGGEAVVTGGLFAWTMSSGGNVLLLILLAGLFMQSLFFLPSSVEMWRNPEKHLDLKS